jgi:hypothetical protein
LLLQSLQKAHPTLESFEPKTYGIPDSIGGYNVLAVTTSENTACAPVGQLMLLLWLPPNQKPTLVQDDLDRLESTVHAHIGIAITSGKVTIEQVKNQSETWNKGMEIGGCESIGGPVGTFTPR